MLSTAKSAAASMMKIAVFTLGIIFALGAVSPVSADTIGIAVASVGSSTQVGLVPAGDGTISFYIPLTLGTSGTYGIKGLASETCSYPGSCGGGTLDMFLSFAPVQIGANVLTLNFSDLDIKGANDPSYFLESVTIIPNGGVPVLVDETTDPTVFSANAGTQVLVLPLTVASNPFYVQLHFSSSFVPGATPSGTYANTVETVKATIRPVPEPLTLATMGLGLLALGVAARRKNKL